MAKKVCRSRSRGSSKANNDSASKMPMLPTPSTPQSEAGVAIARGVLVGARIAKRFDVPTPSRRTKTPKTKTTTKTKKRRGRPPKKNALPSRPETPPPTIITKEVYYGTVTGYNHLDADYVNHDDDVGLYRVHYDDGDTEVLDPDEMYAAFLLHNSELLRMDIERCRSYPSLASKIAPTWREATTGGGGGGGGGGGLAHQRDLTEDELIVLDAERIGYWESYKAYNISTGVARPLPFSPTTTNSSRDNRKHRPLELEAAVATTRTSTGGQTAGEFSGSNEVVQPSSASGSASSMATRRSERAITRASATSAAAAAATTTDGSSVAMSSTPRRNKRRGAEAPGTSEVAAGSSVASGQGSSKRRRRASDTASSNTNTVVDSNPREGGQEGGGSDSTETSTRVKEETSVTGNRHGWGLFRWTQTVGFGDICDLT